MALNARQAPGALRSTTGCLTCRRRKKKCNEQKPVCIGCDRNRLQCRWPTVVSSGRVARRTSAAHHAVDRPAMATSRHTTDKTASQDRILPPVASNIAESEDSLPSNLPSNLPEPVPIPSLCTAGHDAEIGSDARRSSSSSSRSHVFSPSVQDISNDVFREADSPNPHQSLAEDVMAIMRSPLDHDLFNGNIDELPGFYTDIDLSELLEPSPSQSDNPECDTSNTGAMVLSSRNTPRLQDGPDNFATSTMEFSNPEIIMGPSLSAALCSGATIQDTELLSYYLSRTANSMGNGSTDVNPFIAQLVPLAFSQVLVLRLILAQSAAQRYLSAKEQPVSENAQRRYAASLREFRRAIGEYNSGKGENLVIITVGSLILCLTEVCQLSLGCMLQDLIWTRWPEVTSMAPFLTIYRLRSLC